MSRPIPQRQGLYDPRFEHDACGVGFVVDMKGRASHDDRAARDLGALLNLEHRGATGAETNTGDGAGILIQMPDAFLRAVVGVELPAAGEYAAGMAFLPTDEDARAQGDRRRRSGRGERRLEGARLARRPFSDSMIGEQARETMPEFRQLFISGNGGSGMDLERRAYVIRKRIEHEVGDVYFPSLSARTLVYKGMLPCPQLAASSPISSTRAARRRSRSCTPASRRTRSRRGRSRIPTG